MCRSIPCFGFLLLCSLGCSGPKKADVSKGPVASEVTFTTPSGIKLTGTYLSPPCQNLPAVLLLPGSGPTDRNGNQPPQMVTDLLKQIAEGLAEEGIASFRFDKRAAHVHSKIWPTSSAESMSAFFSWKNFIDDAKAALKTLQSQPGVDPRRVAIAGHSEGSNFAIQIGHDLAGKPDAPKALVLMAGPGRPMGPIIREQISASLGRAQAGSELIKVYMDYTEAAIKECIEKGTFPANPPPNMNGIFNPTAADLVRAYLTVDPAKVIKAFPGPVLILQGAEDIQVSAERDTPLLEKALKARGGKFDSFIVPQASHNFKKVTDANKEPGFSGPMVPAAFEKLSSWLKASL